MPSLFIIQIWRGCNTHGCLENGPIFLQDWHHPTQRIPKPLLPNFYPPDGHGLEVARLTFAAIDCVVSTTSKKHPYFPCFNLHPYKPHTHSELISPTPGLIQTRVRNVKWSSHINRYFFSLLYQFSSTWYILLRQKEDMCFDPSGIIAYAKFAYGGMAAWTISTPKMQGFLTG